MKASVIVIAVILAAIVFSERGLAQQRDQEPLRRGPRITAQQSLTKSGTIVIDVLNDNLAPIDALRLEMRWMTPPVTRESRQEVAEDYYLSIGAALPEGEGSIQPGESRRFLVNTGTANIDGVKVAVRLALYRDGILAGDPKVLPTFTDRRESQARELGRLLKLIEHVRSAPALDARGVLRSGLAERREAVPDRYVSASFAEQLYAQLEAVVKVPEDRFAQSLGEVQARFEQLNENATRVYSIR